MVLVRWCRRPSTRNEQESGKGRVFAISGWENLFPHEKCSIRNHSVNLPRLRSAPLDPTLQNRDFAAATTSRKQKPKSCNDENEDKGCGVSVDEAAREGWRRRRWGRGMGDTARGYAGAEEEPLGRRASAAAATAHPGSCEAQLLHPRSGHQPTGLFR